MSDAERVGPAHERRLAVTALVLGCIAIGVAFTLGLWTNRLTTETLEARYRQFYLDTANLLRRVAELNQNVPDETVLAQIQMAWEAQTSHPGDAYICIVDHDSRLVLHSAAPDTVGNDAGVNPLLDARGRELGTLGELAKSRGSYTGGYLSSAGQEQLVAFAALPRGWTLGVHRSRAALHAEIAETMYPVMGAFLVTCGIVFPLSLVLLYIASERALRRQRQTASGLRESEYRFRRAIVGAPVPAMVHADDGEVLAMSDVMEALTGYTLRDRPNVSDWSPVLVGAGGLTAADESFEDPATDPVECIISTRDGAELRWRMHSATLGRLPDGRQLVATMGVDVTDSRRLEQRLHQAEKMEAIGTLAGGIAHNFNNTLFAVSGNLELALQDLEEGSPLYGFIREAEAGTRRAADLVSQMLLFSRQHECRRQPMWCQPVLTEAVEMLRSSLPTSIDIQTCLDEACGPVLGDPMEVRQIVMNLGTNAYQAIGERAGSIYIRYEQVEVSAEAGAATAGLHAGAYAKLTVRDTGSGMDTETERHVFEPYFTTKGPTHGAGLGLATVHGLVQDYGGAVDVESRVGTGTTFTIFLPLCDDRT